VFRKQDNPVKNCPRASVTIKIAPGPAEIINPFLEGGNKCPCNAPKVPIKPKF
jgi:hypothetical protein